MADHYCSSDDAAMPPSRQIALASTVESLVTARVHSSPQDRYLVITQPGLQAADMHLMPKLRARVQAAGEGAMQVAEVIGDVSLVAMAGAEASSAKEGRVRDLGLPALDGLRGVEREDMIVDSDITIDRLLRELEGDGSSWVLILAGTSPLAREKTAEDPPYEMDEPYLSPLHTDLKRDTRLRMAARKSNGTDNSQSSLPLFEKYQFLTPPLFMGLSVTVVLFLLLYVGVTAIAGLEVSYAAFSKEMGPQAQNKGKQQ
ncbi:hypothetical protein LTR53_006674 [Teratosphaeriaceae sp. CCFEE 6253]|nr:hypothetical protein LTR53_006674 [Teratosphaeriaceae sp. CCFEE 6253]